MRTGLLMGFLFALSLAGCASDDSGHVQAETSFVYAHTRDFLNDQVRAQLAREWPDPKVEAETGAWLSDWKVQLAVMSRFGRRDRLRVRIESAEGGFKVSCEQESQRNMEQEDPLSASKAEWKALTPDGALAKKFLFDLHRTLNPKQAWREATIR